MNCGNKFISLVRTLICHGYTYVSLFLSIALINAKAAELTSFKNGLNKISAFIGYKAQIKVSKKDQGNISIPFHSKEEFERILKLFKGD